MSVRSSEQIWPALNQSINLPLKGLARLCNALLFKKTPHCLQRIFVFRESVGVQLALDSIEETDHALLPFRVCHRRMVCLFWHERGCA
jgi:hypothetical protein